MLEYLLKLIFLLLTCLRKLTGFVNPMIYENIYLQSDRNKQKHFMVNCFFISTDCS